jgi:DNA polymerase-1
MFLGKFRGIERVHGLIKLGGSQIGRTSADHINLQNIPRQAAVRRLFGASEYDWLKLDFAQAELVVAAVLSGCQPLLGAFQEGRDPHVETASRIFGVAFDAVMKDQRAIGKLLNFALLYGAGVGKVLEQAELAGISLSFSEAEAFRNQWFLAYPEIAAAHEKTRRRLWQGDPVTSVFGRRWLIDPAKPRGWNQALQAPVASTASDLLLLGLDAVWDRLEQCGQIVNLVHDEVDVLIPKGSWPDLAPTVRAIATMMAGINAQFPMRVEVSVGPDWGSTIEQFTVGAS